MTKRRSPGSHAASVDAGQLEGLGARAAVGRRKAARSTGDQETRANPASVDARELTDCLDDDAKEAECIRMHGSSWADLGTAAQAPRELNVLAELDRVAALLEKGRPLPLQLSRRYARAFRDVLAAANRGDELPSLNRLLELPSPGATQRAYRDRFIREFANTLPGESDWERAEIFVHVVKIIEPADPVLKEKARKLREMGNVPTTPRNIYRIIRKSKG